MTVAAKIILPFAVVLTGLFAAPLKPFLGPVIGNAVAATTVLFLPGVFGFLVWELRSNWRLYAANRPANLGPIAVGSHGETVVRFLRPAFHSGTLPKRFARLRRALRAGREPGALKHREALTPRRVGHAPARRTRLRRPARREPSVRGRWSLEPGSIRLATNRIRIELPGGDRDRPSLWIDLEERSGVLAAGVSQRGWPRWPADAPSGRTLADALAGLYKIGAVERVHPARDRLADPAAKRANAGAGAASPAPDEFDGVAIPWRDWVQEWDGEASRGADADGPPWRAAVLPDTVPAPGLTTTR